MMIDADPDFSRYGLAAAIELTVCIMSVRNDFSQVSGVSPTASALTLQTMVSMPPSLAAAPSTHAFNAVASATSIGSPQALTPLAASVLTAFPTSSALRAQIATLAPSSAKSSAIASPMPLVPPVTSTFFPFSPRSMAASLRRPRRISYAPRPARSHLGPIAGALEGGGSTIDRRLVVVFADQHQPDRKSVAHATGNAHGRMSAGIEGRRVRHHLECTLDIQFTRRVRGRQRRRLHRQRRHQQQIVFG